MSEAVQENCSQQNGLAMFERILSKVLEADTIVQSAVVITGCAAMAYIAPNSALIGAPLGGLVGTTMFASHFEEEGEGGIFGFGDMGETVERIATGVAVAGGILAVANLRNPGVNVPGLEEYRLIPKPEDMPIAIPWPFVPIEKVPNPIENPEKFLPPGDIMINPIAPTLPGGGFGGGF